MSPEILLGTGHSYKTDIWSLGVLIWEIWGGFTPFNDSNPQKMNNRIITGKMSLPKTIDYVVKDLIKLILTCDPHQRIELEEIKSHAYFRDTDWTQMKNRSMIPPYVPQDKTKDILFWDTFLKIEEIDKEEKNRVSTNFLGDFTLIKVNKEFENF